MKITQQSSITLISNKINFTPITQLHMYRHFTVIRWLPYFYIYIRSFPSKIFPTSLHTSTHWKLMKSIIFFNCLLRYAQQHWWKLIISSPFHFVTKVSSLFILLHTTTLTKTNNFFAFSLCNTQQHRRKPII